MAPNQFSLPGVLRYPWIQRAFLMLLRAGHLSGERPVCPITTTAFVKWHRAQRVYSGAMKKSALGLVVLCLVLATTIFAKFEGRFSRAAGGGLNCISGLPDSLSLNCVSFSGHLYAVAEIDLRRQKIVFSSSGKGKKETFPEVLSDLTREGIKPLLMTNAGIYGTDNRPLGLLISPKGVLHEANTRTDAASANGNFSWDSAVFQISDEDVASIVPVRDWHSSPHIVAATQSGPQLASMGKINASIPVHSESSFLRTAIGVDRKDRSLVHLVVSREPVTLFELADLMASNLHCSEALHLDGDLSAFYLPSTLEKFLFADPRERIVTTLSVTSK
jgi:uncharacterized protein YigE (DUF2233 family)